MATLYFSNTVDNAWDTLGNWFTDEAFSIPASALPTTGDTVHLYGALTTPPTTSVTLTDIYLYNYQSNFTGAIGNATVGYGEGNNTGTCNGNFYASVGYGGANAGTVTGDAIFDGDTNCVNTGTINGNAEFRIAASNNGTVIGNATFVETAANYGTVNGNATFNNDSMNYGTVELDATFNDYSQNIQSPSGIVEGDASFYDYSGNNDYSNVYGDAHFYDQSWQEGGVMGTAYFYENDYSTLLLAPDRCSVCPQLRQDNCNATVFLGDAVIFNHPTGTYWQQMYNNTYWSFPNCTPQFIFNGDSHNDGIIVGDVIFNDASYMGNSDHLGSITGNVTFNDNSNNMGNIYGNAIFNDSSSNGYFYEGWRGVDGFVSGNATFNDSSKNIFYDCLNNITGYITWRSDFATFDYNGYSIYLGQVPKETDVRQGITTGVTLGTMGTGINGSNILGF